MSAHDAAGSQNRMPAHDTAGSQNRMPGHDTAGSRNWMRRHDPAGSQTGRSLMTLLGGAFPPVAATPDDHDVHAVVQTPMGPMLLAAHATVLTGAWFVDQPDAPALGRQAAGHPILTQAALELADWFAGTRRDFSLALAPQGTPFQRRVWDALLDLRFGQLESYGDLSRRLGNAAAVRAVAQAVGRNPISLFIPCHRIVGSDTSLTGFGGGLARKRALLAHEGHTYVRLSPQARRVQTDPGQGTLPW
jgi:methylated-DNA-[protein]-cysteine S-methyltransferase